MKYVENNFGINSSKLNELIKLIYNKIGDLNGWGIVDQHAGN